jgi:hypothetical protein
LPGRAPREPPHNGTVAADTHQAAAGAELHAQHSAGRRAAWYEAELTHFDLPASWSTLLSGLMMTDIQILTIAIAVIVPISSLIFSNSRIADLRESLNKRIEDFRTEVNRRLDNQQGLLETIMGKLEELDRRTLRP